MDPELEYKFSFYPIEAQRQLDNIRRLIFTVAEENGLGEVEEACKWGEASYLVKGGSTIRIDWKSKDSDVIKVYFHCQTTLIDTFKEIYHDDFEYEGKRAIVIPLDAKVEQGPLGHCIGLALKYHSVKHLPLLGS
ncbi:DUF1801 domain-containing protein [Thalassotalea piscium]|uniref:YdhG-like domain-containing protein n=1 Tax=Thalassotalea piscium TaxID=1230533 RepID=A0A7X0NJS1_9GAMM|nr:DUF1801 domain-containing protein [Thalassotalea piscium]MBB6544673.1 hypothetical protein [Thalassotalea piscium]